MNATRGRETLYKGIKMRSRLEADYAADLDRQGYRWEYEPECFANEAGQWLPDFGCTFADTGPLAIFDEVKPAEPLQKHIAGSVAFTEHVDAVLRRMMIALDSRPDIYLRLTFWQYGGRAFLTLFRGYRGGLWLAHFGDNEMELIWPGMDQFRRCQGHDIAHRWRGLIGPMAAHTWPGNLRDGVFAIYADSVEWAARAEGSAERLVEVLNLVLPGKPVRKVSIRLDDTWTSLEAS